jgi:hypothetical protein
MAGVYKAAPEIASESREDDKNPTKATAGSAEPVEGYLFSKPMALKKFVRLALLHPVLGPNGPDRRHDPSRWKCCSSGRQSPAAQISRAG